MHYIVLNENRSMVKSVKIVEVFVKRIFKVSARREPFLDFFFSNFFSARGETVHFRSSRLKNFY